MPLHGNIDETHLQANGLLLNPTEIQLVKSAQQFMQQIQVKTLPLLAQQKEIDARKSEVNELRDTICNPMDTIDSILNKATFAASENPLRNFKGAVGESLNNLKMKVKSKGLNDFIDAFSTEMNALNLEDFDNVHMLYGQCYSLLEDIFNDYREEFTGSEITSFDAQLETLLEEEKSIENALAVIKSDIQSFKEELNLDFEIDESYQITKISKRSDNLSYSVALITDSSGKITPYALYRGKERILGSGGFGDVKLSQNLETGEWCAVKIQRAIMRELSQPENAVLSNFHRFKGQMIRESKYYSIQSLLPGVNLKKHLDTSPEEDLATRLLIAKQAITLISNFHEKYLHRDIKPENLMWDSENKELFLCDFGLACNPDSQGAFKDLSGSGTYLAPEIDDQYHKGQVHYTKKSDIYALGKTLEEVFEGVEVPSDISSMLDTMTAADPCAREGDMRKLLDTVDMAIEQLERPALIR